MSFFAERLWSYDAGKTVIEDGKEVFQGDMLQYRPSPTYVQLMQNIQYPSDTEWLSERPHLQFKHQENWILHCLLKGEDPIEHKNFETACPDWSDVLPRLRKKGWLKKPLLLTETGRDYIEELTLHYPKELPQPENFRVHVGPMATGAQVKEDELFFSRLSNSMRKVIALDMEASGLAALAEAHKIPCFIAKGVSDYGDHYKDDRYRHFAARASAEALIRLLRETAHMFMPPVKSTLDSPSSNGYSPSQLVNELADLYPDVESARALWERAGGKGREVENIPRPRDLWHKIIKRCNQGASVNLNALIGAVLQDFPKNSVLSTNNPN